jgi:hypothetical protein
VLRLTARRFARKRRFRKREQRRIGYVHGAGTPPTRGWVRKSEVLEPWAPEQEVRKQFGLGPGRMVKVPESFSLTEDPDGTIQVLREFAAHCRDGATNSSDMARIP